MCFSRQKVGKMDYIRRVYVAGVGYTCYLTEVLNTPTQGKKGQEPVVKKEIAVANYQAVTEKKGVGSYFLNLKIGYSDIKTVDITKYISDKEDPMEFLVVGKEILTTPGYQEIFMESEAAAGTVVSPIKAILIIRGNNKEKVNSLAASIRNIRPYSVYKGIGLRLQGEPLNLKVVVKNKQKG